jgi:hypothetical protein
MSNNKRSVHVATITKHQGGKTYVTHLLRHTYRENGKVKQLTLGNLSDLPDDLIQVIRKRLSGEPLPNESDDFQIVRSLPHGHVAAVLGMLRKIGLDRLIASKPCREAQLVVAMIVLRIIAPGSRLANLTSLQPETAEHSLADELQLEEIETPELYEALDWLFKRQTRIENKLAKKHLEDGTLVLYDVSSSYYTGRQSDLIRMGYSRDGKPGQPQIVYGLLCAPNGCPVAIEVFSGNTADPTTFTAQVKKIRKRFGIDRVVFVGDRGMITSKRIKEDRIKSHVFLCMLAYYLEWHMRGNLVELLFDDHEREAAESDRASVVSKAPRSKAAKHKEQVRRTSDGFPVQSFQCLLKDLGTLCKNRVCWKSSPDVEFDRLTEPTNLQRHAFGLLGISIG